MSNSRHITDVSFAVLKLSRSRVSRELASIELGNYQSLDKHTKVIKQFNWFLTCSTAAEATFYRNSTWKVLMEIQ